MTPVDAAVPAPIVSAPIVLAEWDSVECDLDRSVAAGLADTPHQALVVTPVGRRWRITAQNMVGVVQAGDQRVVIRPKIGTANTLALLDVPADLLRWQADGFDYDAEDDLLVAVVRLFRRGLDRALVQGLRHDYRVHHESLQAVRGRIDMATVVRRPGAVVPVPCVFDEYTADTPLNRVLAAAIQRALQVPGVPPAERMALRRHLLAFDGVGRSTGSLDWLARWVPTRLDQHYEPAVRPAALILGDSSLVDRPGQQRAASFLVDMNRLVEEFITDRLRRALQGRLRVVSQARLYLDDGGKVPVRPDLVFYDGDRPVFVADVKYKMFDTLDGERTADLYQLNAYCQVLGVPAGALISCVPRDQMSRTRDRIRTVNSDTTLHLWPVNLTGSLERIESEMVDLANALFFDSHQCTHAETLA